MLVFAIAVFASFVYLHRQRRPRLGPAPAAAPVGPGRQHRAAPPRSTVRRVGQEGRPRRRSRRGGGLMALDFSNGLETLDHNFVTGQGRRRRQVGADPQHVAGHLRPGLLRHRDDGHRRRPLRPRPLRHGGLPGLAAPGRPHDRRRPGVAEDGPGPAADLRPDDGTQVGHLHGRLRQLRRHVQQLRHRAGRRPDRPGRRLRPRLPARARDAHPRHRHAPRQDRGRRHLPAPGRERRRRRPSRSRSSTASAARSPSSWVRS